MLKKIRNVVFFSGLILLLSACSSFSGLRTPLYDGEPFVAQPDKIEAYARSREIIGEEKGWFLPEPFSADILKPTLEYAEHEPVLLEEERIYTVGVDFPASRVTVIGEKNDPNLIIDFNTDPFAPPKPEEYEVGTMTVRDAEGNLYFENMFHPFYGVNIIQVDLIEGHTIEITGNNPKVVLFYDEILPENPYVFDTRWEDYIAGLEAEGVEIVEYSEEDYEGVDIPVIMQEQPLVISKEEQTVEMNAGIYEVGKHLEAGTYEVTEQSVPSHTAFYVFRGDIDPKVFELSKNLYGLGHHQMMMNSTGPDDTNPVIVLEAGDKIYPRYVGHILLTKIDE